KRQVKNLPILFIVGHAQGASPCTRPKPLHPATLEVGELRAVRLNLIVFISFTSFIFLIILFHFILLMIVNSFKFIFFILTPIVIVRLQPILSCTVWCLLAKPSTESFSVLFSTITIELT